jgi:hypothetical protein
MRRLLVPTLVVASAAVAFLAAAARAEPSTQAEIQITGVLSGWRLDVDRRVYFLITRSAEDAPGTDEGSSKEKGLAAEPALWFHSPPDRDVEREFNKMILDAILALGRSNTPVTVTAKAERSLDGTSPEKSLPLVSIASP